MGIWNGHGTFGDGIGDFGNEVWTEMRPTCMELEKGWDISVWSWGLWGWGWKRYRTFFYGVGAVGNRVVMELWPSDMALGQRLELQV